jgi:RNA polymerase sigma-70 factor (ECF subfamily)
MIFSQLILQCQQQQVTAQRYLYDSYAAKYYMLCKRYVAQAEDAEEVHHNGWLQIFKHLPRYTYINEAATHGWMRQIMINACLQHLRSKRQLLMAAESAAEEVAVPDNGLQQLSANELLQLMMQLPAGYRTVFNLYVVEGMTHKAIAALLGITEGTSKSQLNKARKLLQEWYHVQHQINYYATER